MVSLAYKPTQPSCQPSVLPENTVGLDLPETPNLFWISHCVHILALSPIY